MKHLSGVLLGFLLVQFSAFQAPAAEPSRISFGFSSIGAAGTGVWMAKEIGAFEKYGLNADVILYLFRASGVASADRWRLGGRTRSE